MKFRAKLLNPKTLNPMRINEITDKYGAITAKKMLEWIKKNTDEEGYVYGYYADGYMLGDVIDCDEYCIAFEWWVPINKDTLELVEENK